MYITCVSSIMLKINLGFFNKNKEFNFNFLLLSHGFYIILIYENSTIEVEML